jgi:peptide subunit release factor 1 (eRF1)
MTSATSTVNQSPKGGDMVPQTIHDIVERLSAVSRDGGWVVSCYLKLEPRDRARGKYLIKLKNRIKERLEWIDNNWQLDRSDRTAIAQDLDRIRKYLDAPTNLPEGRGIAIFASKERNLFEAVPLPKVFRSRVAVDRGPLFRELVALDDEFGKVLCVVHDRTMARFFTVTSFGVHEGAMLSAEDVEPSSKFRARRTGQAGQAGKGLAVPGEHNHSQRIREEKHRHHANIAHRLFAQSRTEGIRGVVLAGVGSAGAAVEPHLHRYVKQHLIGTARLNPKTCTPPDVMQAVLAVREAKEREWEADHVEQLEDGLGSRWAVNGVAATLEVLARGQVRTLLVDASAREPGFECTETGLLTLSSSECTGGEKAHAVADVLEEAMEEALQQRCQIDVIEGDSSKVDGLAALLRFARR